MIKIKNILQKIEMFNSLTNKDLDLLLEISVINDFKIDEMLFYQGDISNNIMIVIDGILSIYRFDDKGNEIVLSYFHKYSLVAEAATLRKTPLPSSAKFKSEGKILNINLDKFEKLFMSNSRISYAIIQSLLEKVELLQQNINIKLALNSLDKVYYFYKENPKLSMDLKQYEIASLLGITPETLSRNIKKLIKEDKITKIFSGYKVL